MSVDFKFNEDAMRQIVSAAIIQQLTQEDKDHIIAQAIAFLNTTPDRRYDYGEKPKTRLQEAFNIAMGQMVYRVCNEYVAEHPEFRAAIVKQCEAVAAQAIAMDPELVGEIAKQLSAAITGWRQQAT